MARRLVESGRRLIVFDINPSACEEARALNMVVAPSHRAVADAADVVLTSLPTPAVVQEVLVGKDGIIEGSVVETVIDLSTIGPQLAGQMRSRSKIEGSPWSMRRSAAVPRGPRLEHWQSCCPARQGLSNARCRC